MHSEIDYYGAETNVIEHNWVTGLSAYVRDPKTRDLNRLCSKHGDRGCMERCGRVVDMQVRYLFITRWIRL